MEESLEQKVARLQSRDDFMRGQVRALQLIVNNLAVGRTREEITATLDIQLNILMNDDDENYFLGFSNIGHDFPKTFL